MCVYSSGKALLPVVMCCIFELLIITRVIVFKEFSFCSHSRLLSVDLLTVMHCSKFIVTDCVVHCCHATSPVILYLAVICECHTVCK